MKPYPHQISLAAQAKDLLAKYNIAYLAMAERTGKTLISLMAVGDRKALILTKKAAISGWNETIDACPWLKGAFTVTNYQQVHKFTEFKYDVIIADEAHNFLGSVPKKNVYGKIWRTVKTITQGKQLIYLSATPSAQGFHMLYNELALSTYSPFNNYKNFYRWYDEYAERDQNGYFCMIRTSSTKYVKDYTRVEKRALTDVQHLFISRTRAECGITEEPRDVIHWITLDPWTVAAYNKLVKDKVLAGKDSTFIGDTAIGMRCALHQIEGGCLKVDGKSISLRNQEKIDYILKTWGDKENTAIMYNYISEGEKLLTVFKHAHILQATSNAEGVDLSHIEHLIIYSQDFSTARHTQRRCRQANADRKLPIDVHYLLVKKGVSNKVYKTVSVNKKNYVDKYFEEI